MIRGAVLWVGVTVAAGASCLAKPATVQVTRKAVPLAPHETPAICFAPAPADLRRPERLRHDEFIQMCSRIAHENGLHVVEPSEQDCLLTSIEWQVDHATSAALGCSHLWDFSECGFDEAFDKRLDLSIIDSNGEALTEATVVYDSHYKGFKADTIYVLCSAAFHDHPRPMRGEEVEISLPPPDA